jgi:hypothetical protein
VVSFCPNGSNYRVRTNPEGKDRAASCRPLRSWSLGRRSGRVATLPYPPPRPSVMVSPPDNSGNDLVRQDSMAVRLASRAARLRSRAASSLRSRDGLGSEGRPTVRAAADGIAKGRRGRSAQGRAREPLRDRAAAGNRPDICAAHPRRRLKASAAAVRAAVRPSP